MKFKNEAIALLLASAITVPAVAQQEKKSENGYVWPTDTKVLEKLDQWKDLKYGVIFHWGLYSVPGIMESWTLCGEEANWMYSRREPDMSYEDYKKWYWNHSKQINPTKFDPSKWADLMIKGGMKYMVFTTKHHEGFCMYDSKQTDFTIMNSPFGKDPRANIAKEVFNAFREKGFMIGAYFSKPDWHSQDYWWDFFPTKDRNVNYNVKKFPERWQNFCDFTYNQIKEITNGDYGNIDILWLDGAQVQPKFFGQDLNMDKIAAMARKQQPGLIVVDRLVTGKNENYQTPEGEIPKHQLSIPWETCEAMNGWGWRKDGKYKSSKRLITRLIEVVAKGGNYLLGVGPTPEGTIDPDATDRVMTIGKWLEKNGKGIYKTVNAKHYNDGKVWFTQDKNNKTMYAFYALGDKEEQLPEVIEWTTNIPKNKKVTVLANGKRIKCEIEGNKVKVRLPKGINRAESIGFSFNVK